MKISHEKISYINRTKKIICPENYDTGLNSNPEFDLKYLIDVFNDKILPIVSKDFTRFCYFQF